MRRHRSNRTTRLLALSVTMVVGVVACQEKSPTGVDGGFGGSTVTVDVELPWSDFASNLEVFGGYGRPSEIDAGIVALDYDSLTARTLVRFGLYPTRATVRDSTGTNRTDSMLTVYAGRLVAHFDTAASTNTGPVTLALGALQTEWHPLTADWTVAVDTLNDRREWPEPGAGPVTALQTATWDPADADSVWFDLDSAQVAAWADTADDARGARIDLTTSGERLRISDASLRLTARPSIDPDTTVELVVSGRTLTFIYDPQPLPPPNGVRIGGAPSWRTVLDVTPPSSLSGPTSLCDAVGCPHELRAGEVSYAALVFTSRASETAFQPLDSVGLDVRPVLRRSALPKAPLGASLIGAVGRRVPGEAFGSEAGARIEIPVTLFIRALLEGVDANGVEPPHTLALLSVIEPSAITFASFDGPGTTGEPMLRLVLTIGPPVELP